jgi:hypothetical protein
VGLERGSLSLVRITEELLEWKSRRKREKSAADFSFFLLP